MKNSITRCGMFALFVFVPLIISSSSFAQQNKKIQQNSSKVPDWNKKVRVSPKAEVEQTIGLTDVTVSYSRPGVKGRKIWGGLVPYDKVWRAGANEATKITFAADVTVNGKKLKAGSYSFFIIPKQSGPWTVIFNKVADQWGAFEYNESMDALRLNITPVSSPFKEWLEYTFTDSKVEAKGKNSAVLNLVWEKMRVPVNIATTVD